MWPARHPSHGVRRTKNKYHVPGFSVTENPTAFPNVLVPMPCPTALENRVDLSPPQQPSWQFGAFQTREVEYHSQQSRRTDPFLLRFMGDDSTEDPVEVRFIVARLRPVDDLAIAI
jgi:hypothetical protein